MAFTAVLTGTGVSTTLTNGSNAFTLGAADAGILVGSDVVATGLAAGTKVATIAGTTGTLTNNYTGTTGAVSVLYSSKYGSTLTVSTTGATDNFTPQNIVAAGFGTLQATRELFFVGGLTVTYVVSLSGGVFDFSNWTIEHGSGGRFLFDQTSLGEFRGGYLVNGTQFIKTAGPTFYYNNWNNGTAGGSSMFTGTGTGAVTGTFRMHNARFVMRVGSNAGAGLQCGRLNAIIENLVLDYSADLAGANAGINWSFGTLKNVYLVKTNASFGTSNSPNIATLDGLFYVGNYQSTPEHKFSVPSGYTLDKYSPNVLSTQYLGGFNSNVAETYSNPDFSTAGWGISNLKTRFLSYGGWNIRNWGRTVSLSFRDSANSALTGVTLYIKGTDSVVLNAVQAGDYSQNTIGLILSWTAPYFVYRPPEHIVDNVAQVVQVRKNGYIQQTASYNIDTAAYSQPFFLLVDPAYGSVTPTAAAALTGITPSFVDKKLEVSTSHTIDEVYAYGGYLLATTAYSQQPVYQSSVNGSLVLTNPWSVNLLGGALSAGTYNTKITANVNVLNAPQSLFDAGGVWTANGLWTASMLWGTQQTVTQASMSNIGVIGNVTYGTAVSLTGVNITGNLTFNTNTNTTIVMTGCTVTGTISNAGTGMVTVTNAGSTFGTVGTNVATRLVGTYTITGLLAGSSVYVADNTGAQIDYVASSGTSYSYDATGGTGTWVAKVRKYGQQDQNYTFTPALGSSTQAASYLPDTFVVASLATAQAYTDLNTFQKVYDFSRYFGTTVAAMPFNQLFNKGFGTLTANYPYTLDPAAANVMATGITSKTSGFAESGTLLVNGNFTQGTATLSNDVQIRATNFDSELLFTGIDAITIYTTQNDAFTNTSPGAYSNTGIVRFLYGAVLSGVTMSGTVYLRTVIGSIVEIQSVTLTTGTTTLSLSTVVLLQALQVAVAGVPAAVLASNVESTYSMGDSLRLANSVLGGKVSGAGTTVEKFRNLADTKDRIVADVDSSGNRTNIVRDLV